jgi:hypothetical protein
MRRAVCANTVAVAAYDAQSNGPAKAYYRTKHTKHADRRIRKGDLEIAKVLEQFGYIKRQLEVLPKIPIKADSAKSLIEECLERTGRFNDFESDSPHARAKSVLDEILDLYEDPRADHAKWHGTANGVYQAVTAYWSHHSTVRGARWPKSGTVDTPAATSRLAEYSFGTGAKSVKAATEVMMELAQSRGISLEDAGVHVGEILGDDSGALVAKVL